MPRGSLYFTEGFTTSSRCLVRELADRRHSAHWRGRDQSMAGSGWGRGLGAGGVGFSSGGPVRGL